MLNQLKHLVEPTSLEEAIALSSFGKSLRIEFEDRNVEVPEWLDTNLRALSRYIELHRRDALELRLRRARALRETLKTPTEKRKEVDREIKDLEAELA